MTTFDRICAHYARQLELLTKAGDAWLTKAEQQELADIESELHGERGLWHQERYTRAGASESQRHKADLLMRGNGQANKQFTRDLVERG